MVLQAVSTNAPRIRAMIAFIFASVESLVGTNMLKEGRPWDPSRQKRNPILNDAQARANQARSLALVGGFLRPRAAPGEAHHREDRGQGGRDGRGEAGSDAQRRETRGDDEEERGEPREAHDEAAREPREGVRPVEREREGR